MQIVPINRITVNRADRQRRELTNLPELAESIRARTDSLPETGGLINPIVVTRELILVAGERRLTACRDILNRSEIAVTFADELEPAVLRSIELEENIKREQLPWQDYSLALKELNDLRRSTIPDWSVENTAELVGVTPASVYQHLAVANELVKENPRVLEAPKFSVARGIVERARERAQSSAVSDIRSSIAGTMPLGAPGPASTSSEPAPSASVVQSPIHIGSFLEWAPTYNGPRFNFIHCDFPYGIDADKFNQGGAVAHGGYADSENYYWQLLTCLADNLERIAAPSCHIMFWYSMKFHTRTLDFLRRNTDFTMDDFPLIWSKSDNVGILPDPSRGPRRIYETALYGHRGDRKIVQAVANSYSAPSDRSIHMSVKPVPVLRHFFRMFVDTNSIVLDPTCGSGSALRAADAAGAASVLGLELNGEFAARATDEFERERKLRKASKAAE
jgi:hypothetical protein